MKKKLLSLLLSLCVLTSLPASNVQAANRQLNVILRVGTSEFQIYGVSTYMTQRYDMIDAKVTSFYRAAFNIPLNLTSPAPGNVVTSVADSCKGNTTGLYDYYCGHCSNNDCSNTGSLHHTNTYVIKNDLYVFPHDSRNAAYVYLTPVKLCAAPSTGHHEIYGITDTANKIMTVRDYDYVLQTEITNMGEYDVTFVCKTLVHEIGHLYGVKDHYNDPDEDKDDANCIWGSNKDKKDVAAGLKICSTCRQTILDNADRYNHT